MAFPTAHLEAGRASGDRASEAATLRRARRRMATNQALLSLVAALGAWLAVPRLFFLDPGTLQHVQMLFTGVVAVAVGLGTAVVWLAGASLADLARALEEGAPPDALRDRVLARVVRTPRALSAGTFATSLAVTLLVAIYAHRTVDLPLSTALITVVYGACIAMWLALVVSGLARRDLAAVTRVLTSLGTDAWPGRRSAFALKTATIVMAAAIGPTLFVGAVAYHFADAALARTVADQTRARLPDLLAGAERLLRQGAPAAEVQAKLDEAAGASGLPVTLGLLRDGRLVAGHGRPLAPLLDLHAFREGAGDAGYGVLPDALDVVVWRPTGDPRVLGVARVGRRLVAARLAPYGTTILGLVVLALLLGGTLGWVSTRSIEAPLSEVVEATRRVSAGDLRTGAARTLTDDELGDLAARVHGMRERLAATVVRVATLAENVGTSARATLEQARQIEAGASRQVLSVGTTAEAVGRMDAGLRAAAGTVRALAATFREGTGSAARVGQDLDRIASDVEALASRAVEAAGAVGRFSKGAAQVAGDVGSLSAAAGRATLAVGSVESSLRRTHGRAQGAAGSARDAMAAAQDGAVNVRRTAEGIDRIRASAESAAQQVEALARRIQGVENVLSVIEDVAGQTSLLALNASIIAAQAGEHGRSFAVVADQVRDLATRTSASTREIGETVRDVLAASAEAIRVIRGGDARVAEGMELASAAEDSLNLILVSVAAAAQATDDIAEATREQSETVTGVSREIDEVASMAERIAEVSRRQAADGEGARGSVDDIAMLNAQMNEAIASLAERNRGLLAGFDALEAQVREVVDAIDALNAVSGSIRRETEGIQDVAESSAERASDLEATAGALDQAAGALAEELGRFRTGTR